MTRDDIVKLAHEAGMIPPGWGATENQWVALEEFANLVSVTQVEKLARMCEAIPDDEHYFGADYADMLRERWDE